MRRRARCWGGRKTANQAACPAEELVGGVRAFGTVWSSGSSHQSGKVRVPVYRGVQTINGDTPRRGRPGQGRTLNAAAPVNRTDAIPEEALGPSLALGSRRGDLLLLGSVATGRAQDVSIRGTH